MPGELPEQNARSLSLVNKDSFGVLLIYLIIIYKKSIQPWLIFWIYEINREMSLLMVVTHLTLQKALFTRQPEGKAETMTKIAFPTDDGETISKHLGQARYFQVVTLEDGKVQSSERREKVSHSHQDHQHEHETGIHPGQQMIETIRDCQVLVAGGMGQPMYNRSTASGMEVFLTGENRIADAVEAYQQGKLTSDMRRIHMH